MANHVNPDQVWSDLGPHGLIGSICLNMSLDMRFPTWHFDKCRLRRVDSDEPVQPPVKLNNSK